MMLRGISQREFREAVERGAKRRQKHGAVESIHRYYSIIYEERLDSARRIRKVYPVTVKVVE
jgi:hypothetical protein